MLSVSMSKSMISQYTSVCKDTARQVVEACAQQYGFDAADAMSRLGVDTLKISTKKAPKAKVAAIAKPAFPLPFDGVFKPECCAALKQNHGLYTQCQMGLSTDSEFCKACQKQCDKNESGKPSNGTIQDRMSSEFKGPKGDAPKHYTAIMKKLKLTKEQVLEEAAKFNLEISEEHFTIPEKAAKRGRPKKAVAESDASTSTEPKKRGRPKKQTKETKSDATDDLFTSLVSAAAAVEDDADSVSSSISGSESEGESSKKSEKSAAKAAAKAEKEAAKAAAKAEKEAAKATAKAEKEVEKAAKEAAKAAAKAEKEAEKAAKEAEKEAEKAAKEAEKESLKAAKAAKKESDEKEKAVKKAALEAAKSKPKSVEPKAGGGAVAPATLKVKKFDYKGTKYLKSANGVVYNMEQDEVGTWNDETKEIVFKAADEEEEEEYESDDE